MKVMIAMILDRERKESEFIRDGELSTGGHRESNVISCVHFEMQNACCYDV